MSALASRVCSVLRTALAASWFFTIGTAPSSALAVDANTASADELQTIPGIGPATAARIVEAREREPFRDLDDLRGRVRGVGGKKLARMRDAGLEVGSGALVVEALGRARVLEAGRAGRGTGADARGNKAPSVGAGATVPASRSNARPRVEHYVGRPR